MAYSVYILHSLTKDKFYIGYTANLTKRVIRQNQKRKVLQVLQRIGF
jgi:putative endonuclease